jgi:hypothetical protein
MTQVRAVNVHPSDRIGKTRLDHSWMLGSRPSDQNVVVAAGLARGARIIAAFAENLSDRGTESGGNLPSNSCLANAAAGY